MPFSFNPITGQLDLVNRNGVISEVSSDPASPAAQDAWVLKTSGGSGGGTLKAFMGMGFPYLTANSGANTYKLSYRTQEGTTVRVTLS